MPDGLTLLSTGPWDEEALPPTLRSSHHTAEGVWAIVKATSGATCFRSETTSILEMEPRAGFWGRGRGRVVGILTALPGRRARRRRVCSARARRSQALSEPKRAP